MKKKGVQTEILPCPFCGNRDVELVDNPREFDCVKCNFCGARGPITDGHPEDCIAGWNKLSRKAKTEFPTKKKIPRRHECDGVCSL